MIDAIQWLPDSPIVGFTVLLLVNLVIPPIFERLRLPGLVGLLVAGIVLGDSGLGLLSTDDAGIKLLSDVGKIYLMFVAGLEIDLAEFRKTQERSLGFGISTFFFPMVLGMGLSRWLGFGWNASVLVGSLLASHTLLGFPIVRRLGVVQTEAVTVTVGATIVTDVSALLVLAICVAIHAGSFSLQFLIGQLLILGAYTVVVLWGLDWAGREYFRRTGDEQGNQFLFVLLGVFLASVLAQMINVDKIVGAFLAGLAINDALGKGPVKEKIEFVGSTIFIPCFFVDMGLLINLPRFFQSLSHYPLLTVSICATLIFSKFLASAVIKAIYGYTWIEALTMWSLSLPQVAATLAATLVGVEVGLLGEEVFNSVIVMMLVTSILGPLLTERFAVRLPQPTPELLPDPDAWWLTPGDLEKSSGMVGELPDHGSPAKAFTVVVPVANPSTEQGLLTLAALVTQREQGTIVPLQVTKTVLPLGDPVFEQEVEQGYKLLQRAVDICQQFNIPVVPVLRLDDDVAEGISRAAREQQADLIVMGWSRFGLRSRLFGTMTDAVFWTAHCPVAVARLDRHPQEIQRILVPVKDLLPTTLRTVQFAQWIGEINGAIVLLLHVCSPGTPRSQLRQFTRRLRYWLQQKPSPTEVSIKLVAQDNVAQAVLHNAQTFDLVVLRSVRRRTAGGFSVSTVTNQVLDGFHGSIILFGEPHS